MPEWADPRELDPEVRRDLRGLSKEGSEFVAGHLFMAGMLAEEDPALAWRHARAARSKGGRIAVVRETVGLVAYRAGEWAEAIAELRAARRMSGGPGQLPVMADCERALGHPEKAIELSRSVEASELDPSSAAELTIVVAGARADMGQLDAALANLGSAVRTTDIEPFTARLFYAYADLLLQADRREEAIEFFMKAADLDVEEETDAGDRLTELADEEADLSGSATTDFVADDGDLSEDDGETVDTGEAFDVDDESDGEETIDSVDDAGGTFRSTLAEQEKLLMTDEDEDDDDADTAVDIRNQPVAGLSAAQADQLDLDDERAQASTEAPAADGFAASAADVLVTAATTVDPEVPGGGHVQGGADEPTRSATNPSTNPSTTGSLFSHEGGR